MIANLLLAVVSVTITTTTAARATDPTCPNTHVVRSVPGQFDLYVFAMTNQKEFCHGHKTNPECAPDKVVDGLTLHGLWPSLNTGCAFEIDDPDAPIALQPDTETMLAAVMPSATCVDHYADELKADPKAFCLPAHEWTKHGQLMPPGTPEASIDTYFKAEAGIAAAFRALPHLVALNLGGTATLASDDVERALRLDLGAQFGVRLLCSMYPPDTDDYLIEIDFALTKSDFTRFPAPQSVGPAVPVYQSPEPPTPRQIAALHECTRTAPIHLRH